MVLLGVQTTRTNEQFNLKFVEVVYSLLRPVRPQPFANMSLELVQVVITSISLSFSSK